MAIANVCKLNAHSRRVGVFICCIEKPRDYDPAILRSFIDAIELIGRWRAREGLEFIKFIILSLFPRFEVFIKISLIYKNWIRLFSV